MRIDTMTTALLLILAASPLRAQTPALGAAEACLQLEAQALALDVKTMRCEAGPSGLILKDVSAASLETLKAKLFPDQRYLGHAIVPASAASAALALTVPAAIAVPTAQLKAAKERVMAQAVAANFDSSASRLDFAFDVNAGQEGKLAAGAGKEKKSIAAAGESVKLALFQGPPGSGGGSQNPQQPQNPQRGGPPGSGGQQPQEPQNPQRGGPPGSGGGQQPHNPPRQGPPGSGGPVTGTPPSTPPSRPAPVWRSGFPPPAPNWWNTDFNGYDWWTGLPSGYDQPTYDRSNPDSFFYYSGWYRWRDVFATNWERTQDSASISRTQANQHQIHSRSLTSQVYRESKECYYRAVYRYDWVQGGFQGSHWEERFDHYAARCIRRPREYGQPRVYTAHVSFDMSAVQGLEMPWESDVIRLTYDGTGQPRYDFSGAAYRYASRLDDQRGNSESVTLLAGTKVLRAPESDKVQAFIRINAGKVEFVINDDRASYYQGETLRVNARVIRRVVTKNGFWSFEKTIDTVIHSAPVDLLNKAQSVTDLTSAASAAKPPKTIRSSVFIDSWEFSRVNSRISTGETIRRGKGNSVDY